MAEYRNTIDIAAPPDTVFDYLVTEKGMTAWMGERATLVPEPGGEFSVDIAGHPARGTYLVVERPTRVVVTWGWEGDADLPPGTSTVTFELAETADGTRFDLVHADLPEAAVAGHAEGWDHFLPRLTKSMNTALGADDWRPSPTPERNSA